MEAGQGVVGRLAFVQAETGREEIAALDRREHATKTSDQALLRLCKPA